MSSKYFLLFLITTITLTIVCSTNIDESIFELCVEWQRSLIQNKPANTEENFLSSPLGIAVLLAQIRIFANLKLKDAINRLLNWNKGNSVHLEFQEELSKLNLRAGEIFDLKCTNGIFLSKNINVSTIAEDLLKDHYATNLVKLDFSKHSEAQSEVNAWVKSSSENLINEILLLPNVQLLLANILYFKAEWLDVFDTKLSTKGPFTVNPGKTVQVDYMRSAEDLFFAEDTYYLKCKVIAKPYRTNKDYNIDSRVKMYIILPDQDMSIDNLINSISDLNFNQMLQGGSMKKVTYQIPKINMRSKHKFMPFLTEYYGGKLSYEVKGLSLDSNPLRIDDISQETVLEIDEKGTRAASISSATIDYNASEKTFKVDRPFLMLIREEDTKFILFWATVRNPTQD